ncbi:hypothetical protein Tco_0292043 [Tanacetum coccineum]
MADSQSPEKEVKGINSKGRGTGPRKGSAGIPHSSPVPKHALASAVQQERYDRMNGSNGQRNDASRKKKWENKDAEKLDPIRKDRLEKLRSSSLHHSLNDKVPYRQQNRNDDDQKRNPSRVKTTIKEKEEIQEQNNEKEETAKSGKSSSSRPDRETIWDKKDREKDELPKAPNESKPPEKVVIHNDHPDQTITIRGNMTTECRTGLIGILRKHADAFAWTPADMIGIPRFIAEHELKTYPHMEPRVQRKRSLAPDRRKVVKEEVAEWLKAGIVNRYDTPHGGLTLS